MRCPNIKQTDNNVNRPLELVCYVPTQDQIKTGGRRVTGSACVNLVGWLDLNSGARSLCGQTFVLDGNKASPVLS